LWQRKQRPLQRRPSACLDVEYEVLPAVLRRPERRYMPGAPQLYEEFPGNLIPPGTAFFGPKSLKEVVMGDCAEGIRGG